MQELLSITWYTEEPLDLEYKEYLSTLINKINYGIQQKRKLGAESNKKNCSTLHSFNFYREFINLTSHYRFFFGKSF